MSGYGDFDHIYVTYYQKMLYTSYRRTRVWEVSEDAVQACFVALLQEDFNGWSEERLERFLFGQLKGLGQQMLYKLSEPGGEYTDPAHDTLREPDTSSTPLPANIREFLATLTEEDRDILEHRLAGSSDAQVGMLLELSAGKVEYRYRQLIIKLRRHTGQIKD